MKVRTAIRKSVKWGGALTVVLLIAVWIASGWRILSWSPSATTWTGFYRGLYCVETVPAEFPGFPKAGSFDFSLAPAVEFRWGFDTWATAKSSGWHIPLWFPMALVLIPTLLAWWPDVRTARRARFGLCLACGYDRRGLAAESVCPECGEGASGRGVTPPL